MSTLYIVLAVFAAMVLFITVESGKARKQINEEIERRREYVIKIAPNAEILVNNGLQLFFKDDEQQLFGLDESGKTYSYSGLYSMSVYSDRVSFLHQDSVGCLEVGKKGEQTLEERLPLPAADIKAVSDGMIPIIRRNLYSELQKHHVSPTHEYEHEGTILGCDINSKKFYLNYGMPEVHDFSELSRVTVDDVSHNNLCSANYIVDIYIKNDGWDDTCCSLYFNEQDQKYHEILAMLKGIRNRQ